MGLRKIDCGEHKSICMKHIMSYWWEDPVKWLLDLSHMYEYEALTAMMW